MVLTKFSQLFFVCYGLLCGISLTTFLQADEIMLRRVETSLDAAEKWFLNSQRDKGLFRYIYYPKVDQYPNKNNAIRQLMASRLLAEMCQTNPELLPMHRKNIRFLNENWYQEQKGLGYIYYNKKSKLGANAMMLRTLVYSPDYQQYEDQAEKLAEGILSLMKDSGELSPWFKEPDYEYNADYLLTFYSGEALVALVEYYQKSGKRKYLEAAIKCQEFYLDKYVTHLDENYYPAYVPWHTLSLNKLWKLTKLQKYAEAIMILNDEVLELQDTGFIVGRFYNPETPQYGAPHASSDGVYTEGLIYAYEIALLTGDEEHQKKYHEALKLAVQNLVSLQYTEETAARYSNPERAVGALRYGAGRTGIRIDSVQHTMDAYRKILEVFIPEELPPAAAN